MSYEQIDFAADGTRKSPGPAEAQSHHGAAPLFRCADGGVATYGEVFPTHYDISGNEKPCMYTDVYPGPTNVHQNAALTDFATRFELDSNMFISAKLAPIFTVGKRSDIFYKVSKEDVSRVQDTKRAVGATANEIQQGFDTDTYTVSNYAVRDFLPDAMVNNADEALDMVAGTTRFLTQVLGFAKDRRVMALLTTGNFASSAAVAAWGVSTPALKTIQKDFNVANASIILGNLGAGMNTFFINSTTALGVAATQEIQDSVKHNMGVSYVTDGGWPGENYGLPSRLYGSEVVVQAIPTNSAKKGQAKSMAVTFGDNAFFARVEAPSRRTRNCITTFRQGGMTTKTYRDEGRGGVYVEVEAIEVEKITNADGGYVKTAVIAGPS